MLVVHKFALKGNVCQLLHKIAILQLHDMAWLSINRIYYTQCQRICMYISAFVHDEFIFIDTQQTTRQLNRSLRFNVINVNLIKSKINFTNKLIHTEKLTIQVINIKLT